METANLESGLPDAKKNDELLNRPPTFIQKITKSLIVGVTCFFSGLLLATLSPLIALLSFIHKPKKRKPVKWAENLKKVEDRIKEISDPDSKDDWKKQNLIDIQKRI